MTRAASAKIIGGHNFRVLEVDGFPPVVFGCPPGLVKDFAGQHRPLPHHYVLPTQTIVQGRNHFDFEFIIYSFLFMKGGPVKASVYCTRSQKARFKAILNETLFGPSFQHLLQAQFRKLGAHPRFKASDRERFAGLLEDWAADKTLFRLYSDLLKAHAGDRTIGKRIAEYFQRILKKQKWLARKNIPRLESRLARNYIQCAQLKKEMDLFSLTGETGRSRLIDRIIDFHLFDKNHSVSIAAGNRRGEKLQVIQSRSSVFEVIKKDHKLCTVDLSRLDPPENLAHLKPVRKPWFGVTFLGVGSGFSARRRNSCL
ncbi:MAG: hypothetical protein GWM98_16500, partial [Nitrospinaceae bacterium]|nr:hypothetical protein [Nitrospinaceae bacterium]NIR55789.1 hypothetical protein [Nitrospinaceae bacterium]NIS86241.1 hypothetical protein [Nitrospinaceae bacterium]NIT83072.1 hypothetical protein [Nitrospinaceae bacterium]NIU45282.1 hypothetical protein [Nitrospinaceae bacterium]